MRLSYVIGALIAVGLIIVGLQFWPDSAKPTGDQANTPLPSATQAGAQNEPASGQQLGQQQQPGSKPGDAATSTLAPTAAVQPDVELPALHNSDEFVREVIVDWSVPDLWLQREDLIARASVVLQNAADGRVPRRQLAFLAPPQAYPVITQAEQFFLDPKGFARYDPIVDVVVSVPVDDLAGVVSMLEPLFTQALAQLGEGRDTQVLLASVIKRIDNLPILPERVELVQPHVMFKYADPELENLPEFEKQLLRMGPDNILRLKKYLYEFKDKYPSR
jgi:DUF3014 family protein